jgi:hypothetical protein
MRSHRWILGHPSLRRPGDASSAIRSSLSAEVGSAVLPLSAPARVAGRLMPLSMIPATASLRAERRDLDLLAGAVPGLQSQPHSAQEDIAGISPHPSFSYPHYEVGR